VWFACHGRCVRSDRDRANWQSWTSQIRSLTKLAVQKSVKRVELLIKLGYLRLVCKPGRTPSLPTANDRPPIPPPQKPRSARSPSHYPKQRTTSRVVFHRRACCRDHPSATSTVSALHSALLAAEPFADRFAPTVFARPMPTACHRVSRIIVLQSFCALPPITTPISF